MLTYIIIFSLCITCVVMKDTKVCTTNELYKRTSMWSYLDPKDHIIKSRVVSNLGIRNVYTCCKGYRKVLNDSVWSSYSFECEPICEPACSLHQYCESPGICSCLPGYLEDLSSKEDLCRPLCTECDYRHCIAPEVCALDLNETESKTKTTVSGILQPDGLKLTQTKKEARETSLVEKHGVSILILVVVVLIATLVMVLILLRHRTSIMVYFRARYYVIDGHLPVDTNTSPQVYYAKHSKHTDWKNIELN